MLICFAGLLYYCSAAGPDSSGTYKTAPVKRATVTAAISATGTVEPEEVVDVGAQVAGRIVRFGQDAQERAIDYGSEVEEGTVLAQIDDALYSADIAQQTAQLQQAQAGLRKAEADLIVAQAKRVQTERAWQRARKLLGNKTIAPGDADTAQANFEVAEATIALNRAAIDAARAAVVQAQAGLGRAERNLAYCTIRSPVKGVIVDRRVNIGQTVVASLSAPSLFLIAKDLGRLQVWVAVNEADIGRIHAGMPVSFTVDAFPGKLYQGRVVKVRLNATMNQNVVTYTVEVSTDNQDGTLLPYLSANVKFIADEHADVWTVPNAALRWRPSTREQVHPDFRAQFTPDSSRMAGVGVEHRRGQVWTLEKGLAKPAAVDVGLTDGAVTEVSGADLRDGLQVITAQESSSVHDAAYTSPFTPKFGGGGRSQLR